MSKVLLIQDEISQESPQKGLEEYVKEFYDDRLSEVNQAHSFAAKHDFDKLKELAHKWKGYSAPYGFNLLGKLGEELEIASLNKEETKSKSILRLIDEYMEIKEKYLEKV